MKNCFLELIIPLTARKSGHLLPFTELNIFNRVKSEP